LSCWLAPAPGGEIPPRPIASAWASDTKVRWISDQAESKERYMQLLIAIGLALMLMLMLMLMLVLALKVSVVNIERELTRKPIRYEDTD
jgi:hypothetical protein